jgi:cell division protein FtsW
MVNFGVVVGILPTKGLPLPLISLGGSNLLVSLVAIGTVLNIVQENP